MAENRVDVKIWSTVSCGIVHKGRYKAPTLLLKIKALQVQARVAIYSGADLEHEIQ